MTTQLEPSAPPIETARTSAPIATPLGTECAPERAPRIRTAQAARYVSRPTTEFARWLVRPTTTAPDLVALSSAEARADRPAAVLPFAGCHRVGRAALAEPRPRPVTERGQVQFGPAQLVPDRQHVPD